VTVLGIRREGDTASVWMLTNDRPPFEPYAAICLEGCPMSRAKRMRVLF
jgi:hypothetical protein